MAASLRGLHGGELRSRAISGGHEGAFAAVNGKGVVSEMERLLLKEMFQHSNQAR